MGPNLITNGGFVGGTTGWTILSGWVYGSNNITYDGDAGSAGDTFQQAIDIEDGEYYAVTFDITSGAGTTGTVDIKLGNNGQSFSYGLSSVPSVFTVLKAVLTSPSQNDFKVKARFLLDNVTVTNFTVRHVQLSELVLGPELITNGSFSGNADNWVLGTNWAYNSNNILHTTGSSSITQQNGFTDESDNYYITVDVGGTVGDIAFGIGGELITDQFDAGSGFNIKTTQGISGVADYFYIGPSSDFNGTVTNISVREILGLAGTLPAYNTSLISAVSRVQQNVPFPRFVIGGRGGAAQDTYALFKVSSTHTFSLWRSGVFNVGKDFDVQSVTFNLISNMDANTEIIPKLYFDDEATSSVGTIINSTNYSNTNKLITLTAKNFNNVVHGKSNFFLELQFTGSTLSPVGLPIFIDVDILDT